MILPVVMYSYIPNFLTFLRLFAAPILILYLIIDQSFSGKYFGLIIFFFIILTDFFDGYLARKFNTESNIGKVFDPIADKIMVILLFAFFLGINLDNPETSTKINLIPINAINQKINNVISNSFGFGGTNASLIFGN